MDQFESRWISMDKFESRWIRVGSFMNTDQDVIISNVVSQKSQYVFLCHECLLLSVVHT